MYQKIIDEFNSIQFVHTLSINRKAVIDDLIIEINDDHLTIDNALVIKNMLLLLAKAGKFVNLKRPLSIGGWVIISRKGYTEPEPMKKLIKEPIEVKETSVDLLDSLRYAFEVDKSDEKLEPQKAKGAELQGKVDFKDINLALDAKSKIEEFSKYAYEEELHPSKPTKIANGVPIEFIEDRFNPNNRELAEKYGKTVATIRRWRRELVSAEKEGVKLDEFSKQI